MPCFFAIYFPILKIFSLFFRLFNKNELLLFYIFDFSVTNMSKFFIICVAFVCGASQWQDAHARNGLVTKEAKSLPPGQMINYRVVSPMRSVVLLSNNLWYYPGVGQLVRRVAQQSAKKSNATIIPHYVVDDSFKQSPSLNQWLAVVEDQQRAPAL